jgi:hypothetical protein
VLAKSKLFKKDISLRGARALSYEFCQNFNIDYCEVYFVDTIQDNSLGLYSSLYPQHLLIKKYTLNRIGILVHELTHHLEYQDYDNEGESQHDISYQLSKQRVIRWAKMNISSTAPWHWPLRANQIKKEEIDFKL